MIVIINRSKKEAYEVVSLVHEGYIREYDIEIDEDEEPDYYGLHQINYLLFNVKQKVQRNQSVGWCWSLETMKEARIDNFDSDILKFAKTYEAKGFQVVQL